MGFEPGTFPLWVWHAIPLCYSPKSKPVMILLICLFVLSIYNNKNVMATIKSTSIKKLHQTQKKQVNTANISKF